MKLSRLALTINASPTLALNEKARKLREAGKPIINLGIGEPTNLTPLKAVQLAKLRLETRKIKYSSTGGTTELKEAIIQYTYANYGRKPSQKNILVTVGAKQALFNSLLSIVDPNDEVILLVPYWVSYPEMVRMACGKPVYIFPQDDTLSINIEDINNKLSKSTKAIIVNSPSNPSGLVYKPEFISELVKLCEENKIYLIMDDIYHKLIFKERLWEPGYLYTKKDIDSSYIIVINGISKTYGMTGFRIGWVIAADSLIDVMVNIQSQTTSGASILSQDAAVGALTGPENDVEHLRNTIKRNREMAIEELMRIPNIKLMKPDGTFYCFPDFRAYHPDSMILAGDILENANVAVVPGIAFGLEGYLRFSYAGDYEQILEAIRRIRGLLVNKPPH